METLNPIQPIAPLSQKERILIIDSLRGIALLGILMMNIPFFAFPDVAASNPVVMNEIGTINYKIWYGIEWFLEGSQRAIFSMLFGCGVLVFTSRLEARIEGLMPAELFLRRQIWLLFFGLVNAFVFLWPGDILYHYAILGIILFAFRRMKPQHLILAAFICLALQTARENRDLYLEKSMIAKGEAAAVLDTTVVKLTDVQKEHLEALTGFKERSKPGSRKKEFEKAVAAVQGDYAGLYDHISKTSIWFETSFIYYNLWDILIFMFLGLAFFKKGVIQGAHPMKTYIALAVIGLGLGLTISYLRLQTIIDSSFNWFEFYKDVNFSSYEISRTLRALGIFGVIMILYKTGWFKWLFALMQPVGQMAFTNYLMQSVICGLFFYGIGWGMYAKLQRYEVYFVVGVIWLVQIVLSNIWLKFFRFGPMEWLWRSLTYWKLQPMRKQSEIIVQREPTPA